MKLSELDTLLTLPYEALIELNGIDAMFVREVARYYGATVNDTMYFTSTEIKRNSVTIILYSKPKQI